MLISVESAAGSAMRSWQSRPMRREGHLGQRDLLASITMPLRSKRIRRGSQAYEPLTGGVGGDGVYAGGGGHLVDIGDQANEAPLRHWQARFGCLVSFLHLAIWACSGMLYKGRGQRRLFGIQRSRAPGQRRFSSDGGRLVPEQSSRRVSPVQMIMQRLLAAR